VLRAAHEVLSRDIHYTSALGLPALREAIAAHYGHYGADVSPERVVVTAGSSAALLLVAALIVDRNDEIQLADPGYPCNRHFVRVFEGEPVGIPVGPAERYQLSAELVASHWTPRTRGALVASPGNPTGTMIDEAELARVRDVVSARGGRLIVDEIYLGLSYDRPPRSALALTDDAFVVSSFSKHFAMTGWRLGWLVAPQRHVRDLEKLAQNLYIAPSTVAQRAALACFTEETLAICEQRRLAFKARRDFLVPALRRIGFEVPLMPAGGFFVYADCSRFSNDSLAFCREVLDATGVAITPGVDFGHHRGGAHVRFAYTTSDGRLEEGARRLERHLRANPY
jgi:aspartate/methionine/tyrosine aminotransferase